MAQTYTRRINLYINGKEVRNDIASIGGEMAKLRNQQRRMTIGSQEYVEAGKKIRTLKSIINEHNAQLNKTSQSWFSLNKAANAFNKYFGMLTAAMASFTGVALTIRSATQSFAEFDDALAAVMKTTDMSKDEVKELSDELAKLDTRTSQLDLLNLAHIAGKLGMSELDEVLGFVRAADQIVVALRRDLGGVEEAIRELGKLTDIFNIKELYGQEQALLKVGSAIKELGNASTASEGYLVEFAKRTAGIAPQAGVSIQNILGLAATLDQFGQKAEMSSTAYSKLMTTMTKKTAEFARVAGMTEKDFLKLFTEDANEAMIRVFEGINRSEGGFQQMVAILGNLGVEGQRMTSVFGAMAKNVDVLREQQALANEAFEEGTSITNQFNINNTTQQAILDKARKRFADIQRDLGERLAPAYAGVIKKGTTMIKMLGILVEFMFKHGRAVVGVVATIAAYNAATKLSVLWQNRKNQATLAAIAVQKLEALAFHAQFAAIALYNTVVALMTGNIKKAIVQFRAFSAALYANPIGLITGLIVAAGAAIRAYTRKLSDAEKIQRMLNKVNLEAKQRIVEEKLEIERLLKVAQDDFRLKEDRLKAINQLRKIAPEYLENLSLETIHTEKATTAVDKYIKALEQKARVQAAQEKLVEIEKELIDLEDGELKFWDKAKAGGLAYAAGMNFIYSQSRLQRKEDKFRADQTDELMKKREKLLGIAEQEIELDKKRRTTGDPDFEPMDYTGLSDGDFDEKLADFLSKKKEEQYLAMMKYFKEAGEGAFEAFMQAIENASKDIDFSIPMKFTTPEAEELDPTLEYAMEQFRKTLEYRQMLVQAQYDNGIIGEQEYQDRLTELVREGEEDRLQLKTEYAERARAITHMSVNFVMSLMDMELEKAGENEEEKKEIRKKYADIQFLVTASQIISDTAASIMRGFAELGPIAGAIFAVVTGATGLAQLGVVNAERQKMKGYAGGGHTEPGPKHKPVGVVHAGEYIIPQEGTNNPEIRPLIDRIEVNRRAGRLGQVNLEAIVSSIPRRGYAGGGWAQEPQAPRPTVRASAPATAGATGSNISDETLLKLTAAINKLMKHQPTVAVETIDRKLKQLKEVEKNSGL